MNLRSVHRGVSCNLLALGAKVKTLNSIFNCNYAVCKDVWREGSQVGSPVAIFWSTQTRRPRDRRGRAAAYQRWRSEELNGSVQ